MRLAQQLYEGVELGPAGHTGLITYMRTDSLNLSSKFISDAQTYVNAQFGASYTVEKPRHYTTKSKGAQEAHEAIRPTEAGLAPSAIKNYLSSDQLKLYTLIWQRSVATQMAAARLNRVSVDIQGGEYIFRATGQTLLFPGWLAVMADMGKETILPDLTVGASIACQELKKEQHFTEPPARYSDATLVKAMEEFGIGRPSTYAPTIATIEERNYVERDEHKRFKPTDIALVVTDLLVEHFHHVVDFQFTAEMENSLDEIAHGKKQWRPVIAGFWQPFKENLDKKEKEISKQALTEEQSDEKCEKCGSPMIIKTGRFGKFLACTNYPECKTTKSMNPEEAKQQQAVEEANEKCEKCGEPMTLRRGRFGPFLGCSGYPKCKNIKNIEIKMNMNCPKCGKGDIVQRRSKRGKPFYGCNKYPDCDFALWEKPTGEFCPTCKQPLVFAAKGIIKCSNKECSYKKESEESPPAEAPVIKE
jgi:DNA topoisomerase-1